MNKGALQAQPCAAFCHLAITFPAPAWRTNARPDDEIRSALCGWGLYLYYMIAADADSIQEKEQSKPQTKWLSKKKIKLFRALCQLVGKEDSRLGICLSVDWALVRDAHLENKKEGAELPNTFPGVTGSQSLYTHRVMPPKLRAPHLLS